MKKNSLLSKYWWVILIVVYFLLRKKPEEKTDVEQESKTPVDKRQKGVLRFGDVNTKVEELQTWLNKYVTPDISVDGDYGKQTGTALATVVKMYSKQNDSSLKWNKEKTHVVGVYTPWLYKWVGTYNIPQGTAPTNNETPWWWYLNH